MRNRKKRLQRGFTLVETTMAIAIIAVIVPTLGAGLYHVHMVPSKANASLISSADANYAVEWITRDASSADGFTPFSEYSAGDQSTYPNDYGFLTWTDETDASHEVHYSYNLNKGALVRLALVDDVEDSQMLLARGLSDASDMTFTLSADGRSLRIEINVAQDAAGDSISVNKVFHVWMRAAIENSNTWRFRRPLTITNPNASALTDYPLQVDLTEFGWDVEQTINDGDMQDDGDDIRFVHEDVIYELPIDIPAGTPQANYPVRVEITDMVLIAHMVPNDDGGDIRFFDMQTGLPYTETSGKLSYWIENRTDTSVIAWVNVTDAGANEVFMYYGDSRATSESSLVQTFGALDNFSDDFTNWDYIDAGDSANVQLSGDEVILVATTDVIADPSFEIGGSWTFSDNHSKFFGDYSNDWSTENATSARLWSESSGWPIKLGPSADTHSEVWQVVDLTNVTEIRFDTRYEQSAAGKFRVDVLVDGDVRWSEDMFSNPVDDRLSIDVENDTGNCRIEFRVTATQQPWSDTVEVFIDNIVTKRFGELYSDPIPLDGATRSAVGNAFTWTDDTQDGITGITYHVQWDNGGSWDLIPDSVLPGNSTGLSDSDISSITPDYENIRLKAFLYAEADASPSIDTWAVSHYIRPYSIADEPITITPDAADTEVSRGVLTTYSYYLDSTDPLMWDPSNGIALAWINLPNLPVGESIVYIYYGNPSAESESASSETEVTRLTFQDLFDDSSKIDTDDSLNIQVQGGQVEPLLPDTTDLIQNPSFEAPGGWTYLDSDDDLFGERLEDDWDDGDYTAWLHGGGWVTIMGSYAEVRQDIDLTNVEKITFDVSLWQSTTALPEWWSQYYARVYVDTNEEWEQALPTDSTTALYGEPDGAVIDVSNYTGVHAVRFNVAFWAILGGIRSMEVYYDNIQVIAHDGSDPGEIQVVSMAIPEDVLVEDCDSFTWTHDEGDADIKYHMEYSNDGGTSWSLIPDEIGFSNGAGFDNPGDISFVNVDFSGYDQVRLRADFLGVGGIVNLPSIQDWELVCTPVAPTPPTRDSIGAAEGRDDDLPAVGG
ncbi:MAG: DUF2341 domain-containing protein [Chloroflexota bacterium]|nr:DUF2341 domain-containing protein [Chloroflexota bacterium]